MEQASAIEAKIGDAEKTRFAQLLTEPTRRFREVFGQLVKSMDEVALALINDFEKTTIQDSATNIGVFFATDPHAMTEAQSAGMLALATHERDQVVHDRAHKFAAVAMPQATRKIDFEARVSDVKKAFCKSFVEAEGARDAKSFKNVLTALAVAHDNCERILSDKNFVSDNAFSCDSTKDALRTMMKAAVSQLINNKFIKMLKDGIKAVEKIGIPKWDDMAKKGDPKIVRKNLFTKTFDDLNDLIQDLVEAYQFFIKNFLV